MRALFSLISSSCGSFYRWEGLQPEGHLDFCLDGKNKGLLGSWEGFLTVLTEGNGGGSSFCSEVSKLMIELEKRKRKEKGF